MLPEVLADLVTEVRSYLNALAGQVGADPEILKRRALELDAVERKFQAHPPPNVLEQIREPWPSQQMVQIAISGLTWRVLISSGPAYFLTSDTSGLPFSRSRIGTKRIRAFPFHYRPITCSTGSWQQADSDLVFVNAEQALVKESIGAS